MPLAILFKSILLAAAISLSHVGVASVCNVLMLVLMALPIDAFAI